MDEKSIKKIKDGVVCSEKSVGMAVIIIGSFLYEVILAYLLRNDIIKSLSSGSRNYIIFFLVFSTVQIYLLLLFFNKRVIVSEKEVEYRNLFRQVYQYSWDETTAYCISGKSYRIVLEFKKQQVRFYTTSKGFDELNLFLKENGLYSS